MIAAGIVTAVWLVVEHANLARARDPFAAHSHRAGVIAGWVLAVVLVSALFVR